MQPRTILCHFFNEEYLLPYWLKHHKQMFSHGIMIDYNSTDNSCNIIKEICPTWQILPSTVPDFNARALDAQIANIEKDITGWRIVLNVTEYLFGNYKLMSDSFSDFLIPVPKHWRIPCYTMSSEWYGHQLDPNRGLIEQCLYGWSYKENFGERMARITRNYSHPYQLGRHYHSYDTEDLVIFWSGFAPMNDQLLNRRTQISSRIPESDTRSGIGMQHILTKNDIINWWIRDQRPMSYDLTPVYNRLLELHNNSLS